MAGGPAAEHLNGSGHQKKTHHQKMRPRVRVDARVAIETCQAGDLPHRSKMTGFCGRVASEDSTEHSVDGVLHFAHGHSATGQSTQHRSQGATQVPTDLSAAWPLFFPLGEDPHEPPVRFRGYRSAPPASPTGSNLFSLLKVWMLTNQQNSPLWDNTRTAAYCPSRVSLFHAMPGRPYAAKKQACLTRSLIF